MFPANALNATCSAPWVPFYNVFLVFVLYISFSTNKTEQLCTRVFARSLSTFLRLTDMYVDMWGFPE